MLADIGIERPSYLPAGVVPAGASRSDIGVVKDNIKKLVMSNISSSNTENMILTRLIYQHPVTLRWMMPISIGSSGDTRLGRGSGILSNPVPR